ncbi:MAG: hypothetical protein ACFCUE_12770 [Candidatus Bathyarchaeia archaeon]
MAESGKECPVCNAVSPKPEELTSHIQTQHMFAFEHAWMDVCLVQCW